MKFLFFVLGTFLVLLPFRSFAAFEPGKEPCLFLARGSSGIACPELENGFIVNPALLANAPMRVSLFYRNYFGIKTLNDMALGMNFTVSGLPLGFFIGQFGTSNYKEQEIRFSGAWHFSKTFTVGGSVNLYFLRIKNYGNHFATGATVSLFYRLFPYLNFASVVGNLNEPKLSNERGAIPLYFTMGFEIIPSSAISVSLDIFKDNQFDFAFRYGLRYSFNRLLKFFVGFRQQVHAFASGIQLNCSIFHLNYSFELHPELGMSNAFEVTYAF
jgi:hypothetical protein